LRTQSFQINYAKSAEIAAQLTAGGGGSAASARILSARGSVIAEPRTNQLFVTDIPSKLEQVQQLLAKLDIAVRQVLIEARIVEASDSFGKSLGGRLGGGSLGQIGTSSGGNSIGLGLGGSYSPSATPGGIPTFTQTGSSTYNNTFVNLPSTGALGSASPGAFAVSLFGAAADPFLNLEISALEADGKGKWYPVRVW
jgi:type IV pilus assembly protein PilQ